MLSSIESRMPDTSHTVAASTPTSPLNNSLNNILNYSSPDFLQKSNVSKSNTSIISSGNNANNLSEPNKLHQSSAAETLTTNASELKTKSIVNSDNINSGSSHKIYGSSLLCYQNVPPPSPTNTIDNDSINKSPTTSSLKNDDGKSSKSSNPSSTITLAALLPGDSTTLPVKKRTKLRHRLSDVGSWGLRKKDRAHKYRSMNIESLEVLGDPVIEDTFFVSTLDSHSLFLSSSNISQYSYNRTFTTKVALDNNHHSKIHNSSDRYWYIQDIYVIRLCKNSMRLM